MDDKDFLLIKELKRDSRQSMGKLAKKTNIPPTTVYNRIKTLIVNNIITKFTIQVNREKLYGEIVAYILVSVKQEKGLSQREISKKLLLTPAVEHVSIITGDSDLLLKVRVKNIDELNKFILDNLRNMEGIQNSKTIISLEEFFKE